MCWACDEARTSGSGKYATGCTSCTARGIARSLAAFNALHPRGTGRNKDMVEMVDRMMPDVPTDQAQALVREWWSFDRQRTVAA